jgi:hypothetical protein
MEAMHATRSTTAEIQNWDWRRELRSLDAAIAAVESHGSWDWRSELAELEAGIDQLASRYGLTLKSA